MASTYVNDLRLEEIGTGDQSGTWGATTNTNLELIAEAFSFGTEAITTNADTHTTTIADGATDPGRSMYLKYTGTLDSACTITIGPNTISKMWFIENGTSGSQNIIISQGSGANITIPPGDVKVVYSDGAGSGAAVVDAFASLNVGALTATSLDISGDIDVDGTTNLDVVDIDGAVDMASTLQVDGAITGSSTINGVGIISNITNFSNGILISNDAGTGTLSTASNNTGLGFEAFDDLTSGDDNTAIGFKALTVLTTGSNNTGIGARALLSNTTGGANTAIGENALYQNTTANFNTAVGYQSLDANTEGTVNTGIGADALTGNTTGDANTAIGASALSANTTADNNTAVGRESLCANTTGAGNSALGQSSLFKNTTGDQNTALGRSALICNTTADNNTAVGFESLRANTTGAENTAIGSDSMLVSTTGCKNTFIGRNSGRDNTEGDENVAIGFNSGCQNTTGDNNAMIGNFAQSSSATVSNEFTLGNGSTNNLRCADTSISSLSDLRDKKNIEDIPHGLDYILAMRPVKFDWDTRDGTREGKKDYGFIAQELDQVEETFGNKEYTRLVSKENPEQWETDPMKTYPILIKAIQELSEENKDLKSRIEALESN